MPETLAAQLPYEHQLDQELRIRSDTETWLAETLNGNMRTAFEFSYDGQELYGEDGGGLTEIFDDSIHAAGIVAQENPSLLFEFRRRLIERQELDEMKAMAAGELGDTNTIVVISDFPMELIDSHKDLGGYNTDRKQTMMRVITRQEDGTIRVTTQSLDRSNRQALETIYDSLGHQPEPGELLSQRIHLNLPPKWQPQLIDNLTGKYDGSLGAQFGGNWYAGRRPADDRNTYDFIQNQQDLIGWFTDQKLADPVAAEKLRFKLAATAEARFERFLKGQSKPEPVFGTISPESVISADRVAMAQSLQIEIGRAEKRAVRQDKTYSGCGSSVSSERGDELSTDDQLSTSGFGNKLGRDKYGSRYFTCPNGHRNFRPKKNELIDKCQHQGCTAKVKC